MNRYEIYVSGRIQGVGLRWFIERIANKFSVKGTVRNLPDRRVEIICETDEKLLRNF